MLLIKCFAIASLKLELNNKPLGLNTKPLGLLKNFLSLSVTTLWYIYQLALHLRSTLTFSQLLKQSNVRKTRREINVGAKSIFTTFFLFIKAPGRFLVIVIISGIRQYNGWYPVTQTYRKLRHIKCVNIYLTDKHSKNYCLPCCFILIDILKCISSP